MYLETNGLQTDCECVSIQRAQALALSHEPQAWAYIPRANRTPHGAILSKL